METCFRKIFNKQIRLLARIAQMSFGWLLAHCCAIFLGHLRIPILVSERLSGWAINYATPRPAPWVFPLLCPAPPCPPRRLSPLPRPALWPKSSAPCIPDLHVGHYVQHHVGHFFCRPPCRLPCSPPCRPTQYCPSLCEDSETLTK